MVQKVYLTRKSYIAVSIFLASCLILFFVLYLIGVFGIILKYIWVFLPIVVVGAILGALFNIEKIVFDKDGMTFQQKFRPITIREITGLEIIKRGGAENLKITGLTPDGRKIRKNIWGGAMWVRDGRSSRKTCRKSNRSDVGENE